MSPMRITPSASMPGTRVVRSFGLVYGNTIRARHIGKDILAALKNLFGGEIGEYTKLLAEAREQAVDRMCAKAIEVGANAVVNVRFSTSYVMTNAAEMLAYGDAVQIDEDVKGA